MKFGFLARFVTVLLVVTIGTATALSYVFTKQHETSVRSDLLATSFGGASAKLDRPLQAYVRSHGAASQRERLLTAMADISNNFELVRGVRAYPSGLAPLPSADPRDRDLVVRALKAQDIVQSATFSRNGESLITAAIPLATDAGTYAGAIAIDFSLDQMTAESEPERRFIIAATAGASALIFVSLLTLAIAAQRELDRRRRIADSTFLQTMQGIAAIVDQRDPYTAGHSQRVADYSALIAKKLKLPQQQVEDVRWSALLHDLGKIGIPDNVLLKPGALDDAERAVISQHPTIGYSILEPVEAMATIAPCVLHHHERWDGRGYPKGLAGERIPLLSRVIAVADTFDAMTTTRPYRTALTVAEARQRLAAGAGSQWDSRCIDAALALIDDGTMMPPQSEAAQFGQRLTQTPAATV